MPYFLLRAFPWFVALLAFAAAQWTWRTPDVYPWALGGALAAYLGTSVLLGRARLGWKDLATKMLMPAIAYVALALAALLAEHPYERGALTLLLAAVPGYGLELLFLLTHQPSRYPVNGLSRFNLALVPLSAFGFAVGLVGMQTFIQLPKWIVIASFAFLGIVFTALTEHPNVDRATSRRWTAFGALLGLHVGLLCIVLPVALEVIGGLSALAFAWPLRARRYTHDPKPPRSLAIVETAGAAVLFAAILLVSRWG